MGIGPFKKGRKKSPLSGVKSMPPIVQAARKFDRITYENIQHRVAHMSLTELKDFIRSPGTTVLEVAIASVWLKSIGKGDVRAVEAFTDRMAGPVVKKLSVEGMSFAELMAQQAKAMAEHQEDESENDVD